MSGKMVCSVCGHIEEDLNAQFCKTCGGKLSYTTEPVEQQRLEKAEQDRIEKYQKTLLRILIIALAVGIPLLIITPFGFLFFFVVAPQYPLAFGSLITSIVYLVKYKNNKALLTLFLALLYIAGVYLTFFLRIFNDWELFSFWN